MYKNFYLKATQMADMIRSGEYKKVSQAKRESMRQGIVSRREPMVQQEFDPMDMIAEYLAQIRGQELPREEAPEAPPARPWDFGKFNEDPEFQRQLDSFLQKYPGVTKKELFDVMSKESSMDPSAINKQSGAAGLFQFIPKVAEELGFTANEIASMAPAEQLNLYGMYLDRWDYSGDNSLAIMQAAPAYRNADPDTVIYEVGSAAWKQNPGWREAGDGPVTVRSVNKFYRR